MRQAVGNTFIFGLVMSFTLIFAGFLVLALSYSKAYKLKNEMSSMLERYEGLTTRDANNTGGSLNIMNSYLRNSGYSTMGKCKEGDYGISDISNGASTPTQVGANDNRDYYYCISYTTDYRCDTTFRITLFYKFNLPVLGQLRTFMISGTTTEINPAFVMDQRIEC